MHFFTFCCLTHTPFTIFANPPHPPLSSPLPPLSFFSLSFGLPKGNPAQKMKKKERGGEGKTRVLVWPQDHVLFFIKKDKMLCIFYILLFDPHPLYNICHPPTPPTPLSSPLPPFLFSLYLLGSPRGGTAQKMKKKERGGEGKRRVLNWAQDHVSFYH